VNVGFYRGGVGAQLLSGNDGRLLGLLHDPLECLPYQTEQRPESEKSAPAPDRAPFPFWSN
jgi:hypothetical protein